MAELVTHTLPHGVRVKMGLRLNPHDPRSDKYNFAALRPSAPVDLSQPRIFWGSHPDPRLPMLDQGQMGSCVSFGTADAATAVARLAGIQAVELMHDWLYEQCRRKEQTFPQDAGSDPSDALALLLSGVPAESLQAGGYSDSPTATFDQYTPQATNKYLASFHPIYPTDAPNFETLVWQALDAGYPVNLAIIWTQAMFSPSGGLIPGGQTPAQEVGGHDVYIWGIVPNFFLCDNQWSPSWSADAPASGFPGMRPGSFALPWSYGRPNSLIEVGHVLVPSGRPGPGPGPGPGPNPPPPSGVSQAQVDGVLANINGQLRANVRSDPGNAGYYDYALRVEAVVQQALDALWSGKQGVPVPRCAGSGRRPVGGRRWRSLLAPEIRIGLCPVCGFGRQVEGGRLITHSCGSEG